MIRENERKVYYLRTIDVEETIIRTKHKLLSEPQWESRIFSLEEEEIRKAIKVLKNQKSHGLEELQMSSLNKGLTTDSEY